jgi:hypothetical protein
MPPSILVGGYQHFGETNRFHLQGKMTSITYNSSLQSGAGVMSHGDA